MGIHTYRAKRFSLLLATLMLFSGIWTGWGTQTAEAAPGVPTVIFVSTNGDDTKTGRTWAEAYATLQKALEVAASGEQIWIAKGDYYPTGNQIGGDPRTVHFEMKNGVAIYGGFAGDEDPATFSLDQRDLSANRTSLAGQPINGDLPYHIFYHDNLALDATAVLDGVTITGGNANAIAAEDENHRYGGGMFNKNSSPTLRNVVISKAKAFTRGGGMYNASGSSPVLTNVSFARNESTNGSGGGMFNSNSSPKLTNVLFDRNKAAFNGGGMYNEESRPMITNVQFTYNTSDFDGGGMYNGKSRMTLSDVILHDNSAANGGGMYNDESSLTLTKVFFSGNKATANGGGVYHYSPYNQISLSRFVNVDMRGNRAGNNGGGMANYEGSPSLTNVLIDGNVAGADGGGMHNSGGSPTLTNVTVSSNSAVQFGGGISNTGNSQPHMVNTIIWGNRADGFVELYNRGIANPVISYSLIGGSGGSNDWDDNYGTNGGANLDTDPKFVAPVIPDGTPNASGNYRLQQNSPAINAGNNAAVPESVSIDMCNEPRIVRGVIDLGACEHQGTVPAKPTGLNGTAGNQRVDLTWNAAEGAVSYAVYRYTGAAAPANPGDWETVASVVGVTSYQATGLTNGTSYVFAVEAVNAFGGSERSNAVVATPTAPLPDAPAAPTNVKAAAGNQLVDLSWDSVTGADSYTVYRYQGTAAPTNTNDWTTVATGVAAVNYRITGLTNGTSYAFAVKAVKSGVASDLSAAVVATPTAPVVATGGSGGGDLGKVTSTNGDITIPSNREAEVSLEGKIVIRVPSGAAAQERRMTIKQLSGTDRLIADPKLSLASSVFEVSQSITANFAKPLTLSLQFDPAAVGAKQQAAIFYYDTESKKWIEVGGTADGSWMKGEVNRLGIYAVLAKVEASGESAPPARSFSDVAGHWGEPFILRAASSKLASGYPDGTFQPDASVTRAEFTVMLARALQLNGTGAALSFTDRAMVGSWAQEAVAQIVQAGIVSGYADGRFQPNATITRAEMAAMVARAMKLLADAAASTGFADDDRIPSWAKSAVEALRQNGIISGRGGNRFVADGAVSRAEAVATLLKMLERKE